MTASTRKPEGELDPRIRIRAPLRCDGIGRLDCAEDIESGGRLAVRWLPLEANGDAAVKACEKLPAHPTLPRIRQTGHVGGSAFVAMDFPEGQLLSTMVGGGERLDVDLVIRVAAQLSDALATVHEQQVVHGELSPDSVLLVPADRAYLWDMPLVIANRLTDRRGENRLMQNLVKTGPYLSPERARGDGASTEADVYSLGVVLCVAAGAPLPTASTTLGVVHQVAAGSWTPRVPSLLPDPWRGALARMLDVDPTKRPTARDIARIFAEMPQPAALPTVPEFPAVRLPPSLLAAADALMRRAPEPVPSAPSVVTSDRPSNPELPPMALEAPVVDVVRIPTTEIELIEPQLEPPPLPTAMPPPPPVASSPSVITTPNAPAIALTESVSVSPELHRAGARTMTPDEEFPRRKRPVAAIVAAVVAMLGAILFLGFGTSSKPQPTEPPQKPIPVLNEPVAKAREDEDLTPLPHLTKATSSRTPTQPSPVRVAAPPRRPAARGAAPAVHGNTPSQPVEAGEPSAPEAKPAQETTHRDEFDFLEGAEAPKSALKPAQ